MDPAKKYRLAPSGKAHNLIAPSACQVDPANSRIGTPAQLAVFHGRAVERCARCEAAEEEAAQPATVAADGPTAPEPGDAPPPEKPAEPS